MKVGVWPDIREREVCLLREWERKREVGGKLVERLLLAVGLSTLQG